MSRFSEFRERLLMELGWSSLLDRTEKAKKFALFLLWILTVIGVSLKDMSWGKWWPWLEPWWPVLMVVAVCFLTWKVAIAWHDTRGCIIRISDMKLDVFQSIFEVFVSNGGAGQVFPRSFVSSLKRNGVDVARVDHSTKIDLSYRGVDQNNLVGLVGTRNLKIAILKSVVDLSHGGFPRLYILRPGSGGHGYTDLFPPEPPAPLRDQPTWQLTLRVEFVDESGQFLKDKEKTFEILPDESAPANYRVNTI